MSWNDVTNLNNILQALVFFYIAGRALLFLIRKGTWIPMVLFVFAIVTSLPFSLYWLAHLFMEEEPINFFSAIDVYCIGLFLLLAAVLNTSFTEPPKTDWKTLVAAVIFAAANTALWISWNGDWFRDILGGVATCYLIYSCMRGICLTGALPRKIGIAFGVGFAVICALNICELLYFGVVPAIDIAAAVLWFAGIAYLMTRVICGLKKPVAEEATLSLAVAGIIWAFCTMYLSYEPYYTVADFCSTVMYLLILLALERKGGEVL